MSEGGPAYRPNEPDTAGQQGSALAQQDPQQQQQLDAEMQEVRNHLLLFPPCEKKRVESSLYCFELRFFFVMNLLLTQERKKEHISYTNS